MNTEHRLNRLEQTLGTLISWLPMQLGEANIKLLLDGLRAPEDPDNLEGSPHTPEELAQNARELDAVAPTPADKFQLMFQTDQFKTLLGLLDYPNPEGIDNREVLWRAFARTLKQQRDNALKAASNAVLEKRQAEALLDRFAHALAPCLTTHPQLRVEGVHGPLFADWKKLRKIS